MSEIKSLPSARDRRSPAKHWLLLAMRMILGGVFAFSAISKFAAPNALADALVGFEMVPASLALEAAVVLIWHELICGTFMLLGLWTRATTIVLSGMLIVFEIGLASVMIRGLEVNCGCFGQFSETQVGWTTVIRNLVLLGFCLSLLYFGSWKYSLDLVVKVRRRVKKGLPGWR